MARAAALPKTLADPLSPLVAIPVALPAKLILFGAGLPNALHIPVWLLEERLTAGLNLFGAAALDADVERERPVELGTRLEERKAKKPVD